MIRAPYLILTIVLFSFSLIGAVILVKQPQDWRNRATSCTSNADCPASQPNCSNGQCKGGSCQSDSDCASWETCQGGGCRSRSGCSKDSDCADGKKCNNGTCEGGTTPTCDQCSPIGDNNHRCFGTTQQHCGNDGCWHHDPAKDDNGQCSNNCPLGCDPGFVCQVQNNVPVCVNPNLTGEPNSSSQCANSPDSGCTAGGRGGVDCADCRRTNGRVKQCTDGLWYCCYGDGLCYKGSSDQVVCSGAVITNNTQSSLLGNIYRGCETGDKIGSFTLAPGQSKTADKCTQIDISNYCGAANCPPGCQPQSTSTPSAPTTAPNPTLTLAPTATPTQTPIPTPTPTGTLTPTLTPTLTNTPGPTDISTPTSTPTPSPTGTPTPTNTPTMTPTSTIYNLGSNSPAPTRIVLPEAGVDLPSRFLIIFGSIITLVGFLVLI